MELKLYRSSSDERALRKTLSDELAVKGTLKAGADLLRPVLILRGNPEEYFARNYAYLEAFGRYYFVRDAYIVANGLCEISLEVDVLMTYADALIQCSGRVVKSETPEQYKLEKVLKDTNTTKQIQFEAPFNFDGVNVMVTVNGARAQGV